MTTEQPAESEFLLYESDDGSIKIDVFFQNESVWLTQKRLAELFAVDRTVVGKHLKNIFESGELSISATSAKIAQVQKEGSRNVTREIEYYNLDAIISVGYRVNSAQATQFRIWATKNLREYIIKGFVMDDDRLKQARTVFGEDYFKELLERVRSIRASERRIWLQITDIFAELSSDYSSKSQAAKDFYALVQNKFHFAIAGQTAAEIIVSSADSSKNKMGLTTFKNAPNGRVLSQT